MMAARAGDEVAADPGSPYTSFRMACQAMLVSVLSG